MTPEPETLWFRKARRAALVACSLLCAAGCGSGDGLARERVTGKVTLDGKPLAQGTISFMPADPSKGTAAGGQVLDGAYDIAASEGPTAGAYRVLVSAQVEAEAPAAKKSRRNPTFDETSGTGASEAPPEAATRESIPGRYNAQTTLRADVTGGKPNAFDFPLTSK